VLAAGSFLLAAGARAKAKLKLAIFSKHLQFLRGEELANAVAAMGFDGIDIALRPGGHVEPATVAKDLPALVAILRGRGLEVPMVTTGIADAETPYTEDTLKAVSELGIRHYRFGAFKWDAKASYEAQLESMKPRLARLAALNAKYGVCGMYHTHSGAGLVGASIWDLWYMMQDLDPAAIGINYDVGHATIEGGAGGWIDSFKVAGKHVRGIAIKDFAWRNGQAEWVPIGEGMVKLPQFFGMVANSSFNGPVQLHYEYPLGGANDGKTKISIPRQEVFAAMKKDLDKTRAMMAQAGL
jgi:sugar phosphate isomerase/epimerase